MTTQTTQTTQTKAAPQKPPVDFTRDPWGNPENPFMRMQRQWRAAIDQVSQMEMRHGLR